MAHPWLERARKLWRTIFFWHGTPSGSEEIHPHAHDDHALVVAVTGPRRLPGLRQFRLISRVLPERERTLFWIALAVGVACLLLGTAEVLRTRLVTVPAPGGTVTEALVGSPKLVNPLYAPLNDVDRDLVALIFSGLFRLDEYQEPVPDLAQSYHWSDDGKTLEVTLRKDVLFHDGQPLTAHDVEFTFQALRNQNWRSPLANAFRGVHLVRVDDATVQFQLDRPQPDFLAQLTVGILPAHIWEEIPDTGASLADANLRPVGTGPYKVESFARDSKGNIAVYSLARFPGYYGIRPYLDAWHFRLYPDRTQAEAALKANQVDALAFIPWRDTDRLASESYQRVALQLPQETVAFLNVQDPLLKDDRFRRALGLAVDREEVVQQIGTNVEAVHGPFPFLNAPTSSTVDVDGARKLLDNLGWKLPESGTVRTKGGGANTSSTELALTIDVPAQPDLEKVAEVLRRRWSLLGIRVDIHADDPERLLRDAVTNRNYQVLLWNVLLPPDQNLAPFWSSTNVSDTGLNLSNLADRDVDRALDAAKSATSTEAQVTARRALAETVVSKNAALFLLRPSYGYLVSKQVKGVHDIRLSRPSDRFAEAASWYIKTAWRWK